MNSLDEMESLEIEVYRHEAEREIDRLRDANRGLRKRLTERSRRGLVDAATAGSFAVAAVSITSATGVEPFASTAVALVALVGACFGLAKIWARPVELASTEEL